MIGPRPNFLDSSYIVMEPDGTYRLLEGAPAEIAAALAAWQAEQTDDGFIPPPDALPPIPPKK